MRGLGEWKKDEVCGLGEVVDSADKKRDLGILREGIGWLPVPRVFVRFGDWEIFNIGVGGRSGQ